MEDDQDNNIIIETKHEERNSLHESQSENDLSSNQEFLEEGNTLNLGWDNHTPSLLVDVANDESILGGLPTSNNRKISNKNNFGYNKSERRGNGDS